MNSSTPYYVIIKFNWETLPRFDLGEDFGAKQQGSNSRLQVSRFE